MLTEVKNLSSGLEDYIEAIYVAHLGGVQLKGADLARKLNISRASVSEALAKLVEKKLINYNSYATINLTESGFTEAKKVYEKHYILKDFFETVLGICSDESGENACKIEHIISQNVLNKLISFTDFCKDHMEFIEEYRKISKK